MMIVDEARGVGLGLGKEKEKWEPAEAFYVDTLTCGGSGFLVVEEDLCMVQNESEHLSPATYRQRHRQQRRWRIAGDCSVFFIRIV